MRNLKRALSLALAAVMVLGMMVIGAGAAYEDFTDKDEIKHKEAVQTLVALNVISGKEDGSYFDPTGSLTRAEMAKLAVFILHGGVDPVLGTKATPTYSDIKGTWAEAYIEYCSSVGIIAGDGAGKFNPEGTLTGSQAAKMLLVAMNYDAKVFKFTGGSWEINVNREASSAGLYDGLEGMNPSAVISRDDAALMVYNAIQSKTMKLSWNQNWSTGEITQGYSLDGDSLLTSKFGAKTFVGTFDGNYNTGDAAKEQVQITGNLTTDNTNVGTSGYVPPKHADIPYDIDIAQIGEEFKVIYKEGTGGTDDQPDKKDTIYGVFNTGNTTVYNITKADLQDAGSNAAKGKIKFNDTLHDVANFVGTSSANTEATELVVKNYGNLTAITAGAVDAATTNDDSYGCSAADFATYINASANGLRVKSADPIKFVCNNSGEIVRAYVEQWTYSSLLSTTSSKVQLEGIGSKDADNVNYVDDVEPGDFVAVADFYSNVVETQLKAVETVSGKVDAKSGSKIQIDGTWYDASVNAETLSDYSMLTFDISGEYEVILDGTLYVAAKVVDASVDYAVVLKAAEGINDEVKLLQSDGTTATYIINSDSALKYSDLSSSTGANAVMVKYELVKGGTQVKMSNVDKVTASSGNQHKFDKDTKVLTTYTSTKDADRVASSNAVAFVYNSTTTTWKAFSANTISTTTATANTEAYYATKSGKVVAFALKSSAFPSGSGDSSGYGYVTDVVYTKNNDDNVVNLSVWNGEDTVTVVVDGSTSPAAKGDFIKYTVSGSAIAASEVTAGDYADTVKVKEYDSSRNLVITTAGTYSVTGTIVGDTESVYKMDSSSKIIGVKTADKKGSTYNAITPFTKVSGSDYCNAHIIYEDDNGTNVIKAIFVDEDNKIAGDDSVAGAVVNVTAATVTAGNGSGDKVNDAYLTVSTNKTQVIANEIVTYTVTIHGDVSKASKITLTPGSNATYDSVSISGDTTNVTDATGGVVNIANGKGDGTVVTFTVKADAVGNVASSFALADQ